MYQMKTDHNGTPEKDSPGLTSGEAGRVLRKGSTEVFVVSSEE